MPTKHPSILRIAEYASVSASGVGAIVAIATQQIAYSVIPLSVTAALNLASRRQQEQRISQHIEQQAAQTTASVQQITRRVDGFSQHTQRLQEELKTLSQSLEQIQAELSQTQQLQTQQLQAESQTQDIPAQLQALEQTLTQNIDSQVQVFTMVVEELRDRLQQHDQQMFTFASASSVDEWQTQLRQLQPLVEAIASQVEQLDQLDQTLDTRFQQFSQTQQQALSAQQETFTAQQQAFTNQQQDLTAQQQAFTTEQTDLNQRTGKLETDIADLSTLLAQLQRDIEALQTDFRAIPIPFIPDVPDPAAEGITDPSQPPYSESPSDERWNVVPQLPIAQDYDLDLNLGIDFGTGFTKVCFRDLSRDQAEIVTFTDIQSADQLLSADRLLPLEQTLIPTKLAILANGKLLTGLTLAEWNATNHDIAKPIDFIKMRLAELDIPSVLSSKSAWRLEQIPELDDPAAVESLCAYYLSQVIQRAQSWIQTHHSDLLAHQTVRWSVNVGVPVEYCDSPALDRFQKVLSLAWVLNYTDIPTNDLTLPALMDLTTHLQQWMTENGIQELDCATTPEIAAAVWSFLDSREAQPGFYTFFDVGDGTLDGAAFRFWRQDGNKYVDFYKGEVQPLGVTAFTQQTAIELGYPTEQIRMMLSRREEEEDGESISGPSPKSGMSEQEQTLQQQMQSSTSRLKVQKLVASVVIDGNEKHKDARGGMYQNDLDSTLNVFVGGGGGNTSFFRSTIQSTHKDFNQGAASIPPYEIRDIPPPKNLNINGLEPRHFNRFAVAYGLCIPNWEGPAIRLPSQIESDDASSYEDMDRPMDYDDTKDMT